MIAVIAAVTGSMGVAPRVPIGSAAIVLAGVAGSAAVLSRAWATAGGHRAHRRRHRVWGRGAPPADLRSVHRRARPSLREPGHDPTTSPDRGRRLSLVTLGLLTAGALTGVVGVVLSRARTSVAADRDAFALPAVDVAAPPIPPTVQPKGVALPSFVTSNDDFYRIDTALTVPQLSRADWRAARFTAWSTASSPTVSRIWTGSRSSRRS